MMKKGSNKRGVWGNLTYSKIPSGKQMLIVDAPNDIYHVRPTWKYEYADTEMWCIRKHTEFWDSVYDRMLAFEKMTWGEILLRDKYHNHAISPNKLNKIAKDRLYELRIDPVSLFSLRIQGTIRMYGFFVGDIFSILWLDDNHGDNDTCVCRSRRKHT